MLPAAEEQAADQGESPEGHDGRHRVIPHHLAGDPSLPSRNSSTVCRDAGAVRYIVRNLARHRRYLMDHITGKVGRGVCSVFYARRAVVSGLTRKPADIAGEVRKLLTDLLGEARRTARKDRFEQRMGMSHG